MKFLMLKKIKTAVFSPLFFKVSNFFWVFVAILLFACLNPFAPELEITADVQFLVTEQTNPAEVLQNFKLAYFFRDSLLYSDVLDSEFVFYYFDPNLESSGRYVNWDRGADLKTTGSLFRAFDIINLVWGSTTYEDTLSRDSNQDPTKIELIKNFSLKLMDSKGGMDFSLWGKATFTFTKSRYDQKWRIIGWKDDSYY
jgi:hypothetical protein